jgi:hypothetical protein
VAVGFLAHLVNSLAIIILIFDGKKGKKFMAQSLQPVAKERTLFNFIVGRLLNVFLTLFVWRTMLLPYLLLNFRPAAAHVEAQGLHATEHATRVVEENEAALPDSVEDEHLPNNGPEDDESDDEKPAEGAEPAAGTEEEEPAEGAEPTAGAEEGEPVQHPVGIVAKAPAEDIATYAGRKAVALNQISALQGQVVVVGQSQQLEWKFVSESNPLSDEEELEPGLKNLSELTRVNYKILLAHLFIKLTFEVSVFDCFIDFSVTNILCFLIYRTGRLNGRN